MLSGLGMGTISAQDEVDEHEAQVVYNKRKAESEKAEKQYEMKTVTGLITDDATGAPMGGVRIQALGYDRYSVLTEENGTYSISVPVFVHSLYITVPVAHPFRLPSRATTKWTLPY